MLRLARLRLWKISLQLKTSPATPEHLLFLRTGQMSERPRPDLASAMYPALARKAKAREAALEREVAQ